MLASDLMTPSPLTVDPEASLQSALALMLRFDIRELPVIEDEALVGIITDRDLKSFLGPGAREIDESLLDEERLEERVGEVMTHEPEVVSPETPLSAVCRTLVEFRVGALPVVRGGRLVGIISVTDCLSSAAALFQEVE